jgi:amidohydrolase
MPGRADLAELVDGVASMAVELRHLLHRFPEPGHHEHRTTALISEFLTAAGLRFTGRGEKTGGWVDIGDDPVIGFRADIDALPITEPASNSPRSEREGWMHACGHDAHTAIAAGIAVVLSQLEPDRGYRVLFQPAEETLPGGAVELAEEGLVDGFRGLLAFHVDPGLEIGRIGARAGAITAGSDSMTIVVHGPGGHTSRPHKTIDVVSAAARVAAELPAAIRQSIDARSAVVTAFGSIHGGDAPNVIPTAVVLKGTVRTLDASLWDVLPSLVDKTIGGILGVSGARHTLDYQQGIAPVVNDATIVAQASRAIESELGEGAVVGTETSMGGEDFSNLLAVAPGAMLRLGAVSGGGDLHSASFKVDDDTVRFGIHAGTAALLGLDR